MWKVDVLPAAREELRLIDREHARKIIRFLCDLEQAENPHSEGQGISFLWRYVIMDTYQVIAAVCQEKRQIIITAVRPLPF